MLLALLLLAQSQDFSKVEIKKTHVAGSVWMLQGEGGNIAASIGDDGIAIVDDQFAPLAPKIKAALGRPVKFVINTHWHGDHTGGNLAMAETATIIANENVRKRLAAGADVAGHHIPPAEHAALPVVTFEQGLTLHWNGDDLRVKHMGPGHTDGDSVVFFTKANVVHLGDDFVTYGFPFVDLHSGGSVQGMIAALDELIPQLPKDAKIIPGHGPLSSVDDVRKFRATLAEIVDAVRKAGPSATADVLKPWAPWGNGFLKPADFLKIVQQDLAAK